MIAIRFSRTRYPVAVFAKKHAVPEAFLYAGNLRRQMKNSRGEEQPFRAVDFLFSFQNKAGLFRGDGSDLIVHEAHIVPLRLSTPVLQKPFASDAVRKTEIVLHDRLPFRHRVSGIDYERVALGAPKINRG
jgi:hypothetical protein